MADDTEINPIESAGENLNITPEADVDAGNETLSSPEEMEGVESGIENEPSDAEVNDVAEKAIINIDQDVDETLNGPGINDHLRKLIGDPSYSMVGEDELRNIVNIEENIKGEEGAAKAYIRKTAGLDAEEGEFNHDSETEKGSDIQEDTIEEYTENEEEAGEDIVDGDWEFIGENTEEAEEVIEDVGEDSEMVQGEVVEEIMEDVGEEVLQSEEIVDGEWEFLDEDISPETEEFLIDNGLEDIAQGLSPEELEKFEEIKQLIADNFRQLSVSQNLNALGVTSILAGVEDESRVKEVIKVLLRVGVRMGTRIIAFVADEIVKSADKDDKGTKFLFGSIRDGVKGIESMSDTLITGKDKPERTTKAISDLLRGKAKRDK